MDGLALSGLINEVPSWLVLKIDDENRMLEEKYAFILWFIFKTSLFCSESNSASQKWPLQIEWIINHEALKVAAVAVWSCVSVIRFFVIKENLDLRKFYLDSFGLDQESYAEAVLKWTDDWTQKFN